MARHTSLEFLDGVFDDADEWDRFVSEDVRRREHLAINHALVE